MKTILLTLLALTGLSSAAPVNLAWNPNPPAEDITLYHIRRFLPVTGGTEFVVESTTAQATVQALPGDILYVTAQNDQGQWSELSDPLVIEAPPDVTPPQTRQVVEIQITRDLTTWLDLTDVYLPEGEAFTAVRARVVTRPKNSD